MTGILGGRLPPGLDGYVMAKEQNAQAEARKLGMLSQVMSLQNEAQLQPYRLQQLEAEAAMSPLKLQQQRLALEQARENAGFRRHLLGGDAAKAGVLSPQGATDATAAAPTTGMLGGNQPPRAYAGGMLGPQGSALNTSGLPRDVMYMLMSGDAGLGRLGTTMAEGYKPTDDQRNARAIGLTPGTPEFNSYVGTRFNQGGAWQVSPQGGVQLAPGYAQGMGQVKRAEAGAGAAFDFIDVPMPGGGTQKMSREQAASMLGRQFGGQTAAPAPAIDPLMSGRPPAEQTAIRQVSEASRMGRPMSVNVGPFDPSRQVPFQQTRGPVPTASILGGRVGFQQDESTKAAEKETATLRAKSGVEREDKFRASWGESNDMLGRLSLIEHLSTDPNVASGALADNISSLKGVADSLGVRTQGLPAEEVIKGITTEMSLKMKNQGGTNMMPGAMSDFEQKLLQSMTPRLSQSKEGRMLMIQVFRAKTERDMKISEMAANYVDKNGKLDSGFDREVREFSRANPMFDPARVGAMNELARRLSGTR